MGSLIRTIRLDHGSFVMSSRERAVDHPFEHRYQGIRGKRVVNVGQALLPALSVQKRERTVSSRTFDRDIAKP